MPSDFQSYRVRNSVQTGEEEKRERIAQRKETAKALTAAGLIPEGRRLTINDYIDTPKRPPGINTRKYLKDESVTVYDQNGICIGKILKGRFQWKHNVKTICKVIPVGTPE